MYQPAAIAEPVVDEPLATKVQIPLNLVAGDTFTVTTDEGRLLSVTVPEGAIGGSWIQVIVPSEQFDEMMNNNEKKPFLRITKATLGAAVVGVVVGSIVMGPVGGIVLGGACAYATTRENSKIGDFSRKWGNRVYSGMVKTKRFIERKLKKLDDRDSADTVEPIAVATETKPESGYASGYSSSNSASQKVTRLVRVPNKVNIDSIDAVAAIRTVDVTLTDGTMV
eukprot:gene24507-30861_t